MAEGAAGAGARLVLMTVAQNLADWPPAGSVHERDLSAEETQAFDRARREGQEEAAAGRPEAALAAYRRAAAIDAGFAALAYERGLAERALGRFDDARRSFQEASDLDAVPHGIPRRFNDVVRADGATKESVLSQILEAFNLHEDSLSEDGWLIKANPEEQSKAESTA